ncbi:polyprenyl synthetase family protein [Asticcacaulis machinosus]|uniref:Polyprenyl synthetase family protein n=1 Tax=Asticcacaulis machinosus TaxID=2984211 RepID=A0ABT5HN25_9CAUL|nr:polyprenyl synthetase family protein [Asticcacaulis machinosus]MDC7677643.1 polyprenyl synthetase family protein [Asticcacaulis machinosus]
MDTADIDKIRARPDTQSPVADVNDLVRLSAADMDDVNALIRARMQSDVAIIPALADHLIAAGGKRLRPLLCVAAARLCDTANTHHHNLSAAVEFIHTATLLHDDVVDSSNLRRGKVAAHLIWGAPSSVLVGDFLFSRAFELMVETGSLEALGILSKASAVIAEGEVWQLTKAFDINLSIDTYIEIISAKTAALFAAASESGAVSAKATPEQREALRLYGLYLGLAFQIQDDALDYTGSAADLGKNAGDDFAEGKATLPLLLAVQRSKDTHADFWHRAVSLRQQADGDLQTAQAIMKETGALTDSIAMARDYATQAKASLSAFKSSAWKTALENLADYSVARKK